MRERLLKMICGPDISSKVGLNFEATIVRNEIPFLTYIDGTL